MWGSGDTGANEVDRMLVRCASLICVLFQSVRHTSDLALRPVPEPAGCQSSAGLGLGWGHRGEGDCALFPDSWSNAWPRSPLVIGSEPNYLPQEA